jgi:hypothetical protein
MYGLMVVLRFVQSAELLTKSQAVLPKYQTGILMDLHATKQLLKTQKSFLFQQQYLEIHLEVAKIFLYYVKHLNGLTLHIKNLSLLIQISELIQKQFLTLLKMKYHGMESSKNILFLLKKVNLLVVLLDGQIVDIQANKDHIIAQLVPM